MILVHEIEPDRFARFPSGWPLVRQATIETVIVRREDGSETQEDRACDPYPVEVRPAEIALAWTKDEREAAGLFEVEPFVAADGKEKTGEPRYRREKGRVIEEYDSRDLPPPPSDAQKLESFAAGIGLSGNRLAELIAERIVRFGTRA